MARSPRGGKEGGAAEAVAQVVYARQALRDLERLFRFLRAHDEDAAVASARAIRSAVESLSEHPYIGRSRERDLRELVISFGKSGYVALYRYLPVQDEVRILAIRHQRELGYRGE